MTEHTKTALVTSALILSGLQRGVFFTKGP